MSPSETTPTICNKCEHVDRREGTDYISRPAYWHCHLSGSEVRDFVMGSPPVTHYKYCESINKNGKCPDYEEADNDIIRK